MRDREGDPTGGRKAEMFEDHVQKAAKLAAWFFCQPSGGAAVQEAGYVGPTLADGCAKVEATCDEMVPYWIQWCPTGLGAPQSTLGALPLPDYIDTKQFPFVSDGSEGGARRSL
eukprot:7710185-Pyramimonas_sp.AAC.1